MRFLLIMFLVALACLPPQGLILSHAQQSPKLDVDAYYRLTNMHAGLGKSLSVRGGNLVMAEISDAADQIWKLVSLGGGKYRLLNAAAAAKSLDHRKIGDQHSAVMGDTGYYSGQYWTLTPMANGRYRLTNDYAGMGKSLDTRKNGDQYSVVMGDTGDYSGQLWTLTKSAAPLVVSQRPVPNIADPNKPMVVSQRPVPNIADPNKPNVIQAMPGTSIPVNPPGPVGPTSPGGPSIIYQNFPVYWNPGIIPIGGGAVICSTDQRSGGRSDHCGLTKADWVGRHQLSTTCDKGFYDPIWGGTCWDFPKADNKGTWVRSTKPVDADDAVWRAPIESHARAEQKGTSPAPSWDCRADQGQFWDGHLGGSCWKCPDSHPRRTAMHVAGIYACASPANETARAVFLKYNGCLNDPNPTTMGLQGKRMPGKPFLQLGSGCYACPNADEAGNILVTVRNANPIAGDAYANNQGCTILFKWKAPDFPEPGMFGLEGVKEILVENMVLDNPDILTVLLMEVASGLGHQPGTAASRNYVQQQWEQIAERPSQNPDLSNLLFGFLMVAAQTDEKARTPAEKRLVAAMERYVKLRRTFIAQQALAMYDAWYLNDQNRNNRRAQPQLEMMFDYGTVPLDFHAAVMAGFGLTATGVTMAGTIAGASRQAAMLAKHAKDAVAVSQKIGTSAQVEFSTVARFQSLNQAFNSLKSLRELSLAAQIATLGPAILIEIGGAILISIAIEQFIQIMEARPKLLHSVDLADNPVNLKTLLAEDKGKDKLLYFWSKAMDQKPRQDDSQLVAKFRAGLALARQRGFQVGSGQ